MPNWVNFDLLKNVTWPMYLQVNGIAWKLILPCFILAIVITYLKHPWGSPEFLDNIKRLILTALLLVAFPEIAKVIIDVTHWIAEEISPGGIQSYWNSITTNAMTVAKEAEQKSSLLNIPNLVISVLAFISYVIVYVVTYFIIATRQFIWMVLHIVGPLLIICNIFSGASGITKNLFKNMFEVASWEILWVILFKVLATLGYAEMYGVGDIFQTIVINLIIALAMLGVPFLVKSLIGGSFTAVAGGLQAAAIGTLFALPAKAVAAAATTREAAGKGISIIRRSKEGIQNYLSPMKSNNNKSRNLFNRKNLKSN